MTRLLIPRMILGVPWGQMCKRIARNGPFADFALATTDTEEKKVMCLLFHRRKTHSAVGRRGGVTHCCPWTTLNINYPLHIQRIRLCTRGK